MNVKMMGKIAVVAALYAALTFINPLSFGVVQFRFSNLLAAIPYHKKEYAPGIILGVAIANSFSSLGPIDVLFGVVAGCMCYAILAYGIGSNMPLLAKSLLHGLIVGIIVGIELQIFAGVPLLAAFFSVFFGTAAFVLIGGEIIRKSALKAIL